MKTTGKSVHTQNFIGVTDMGPQPAPRIGITVTKKVGSAVIRNRIKRIVRECFRTNKSRLPSGMDFHIIAKFSAASQNPKDMLHSLQCLFEDLIRRCSH